MSFHIDETSPARADALLKALITVAAYWQESVVPPALRRLGVLGVRAKTEASSFEPVLEDLGRHPPATEFLSRGKVTPTADGESRLQAWPTRGRSEWIGAGAVALLGILLLWSGHFVFGTVAVAGGCVSVARRASPPAPDIEIQHLAERLHLALESVREVTQKRAL